MASRFRCAVLLVCVSAPALFGGAAGKSDLVPSDKRATAIATGTRLAKPGEMPAVAADLVSPFSPPDFDLSDAPSATTAKAGGGAATASAATSPGGKMSSAREIIESMAALIPAKGTIQRGDEYLLTIEGKNYRVGDILNVGLVGEGTKYPLEITHITKTDFTLRYQGEVKTRAIVIKPSSPSK